MVKYLVVAVAVMALVSGSVSPSFSSDMTAISSNVRMRVRGGSGESERPRGIVTPTNCGGAATLVETRVNPCDALPCRLSYSSTIEMDFIPSESSSSPRLRVTLTPKSTGIPETRDGSLGGWGLEPTTVTLSNLGEALTREEVVIQLEILNDSLAKETCIHGTFNEGVVPPTTTTPRSNQATTLSMNLSVLSILFLSLTPLSYCILSH